MSTHFRIARTIPRFVASGGGGATYNDKLTALSPLARWKLNDASLTTVAATVGSDGTYVNTPTLGVTGLLNDGGTAVLTDAATDDITLPLPTLTTSMWLAFWASASTNTGVLVIVRDSTGTGGWFINLTGTSVVVRIGGTDHTTSVASSTLLNGLPHFYVLQTTGTTVSFYIDGTLADSWSKTANASAMVSPLHFGRNGTNTGSNNYMVATYDDVAVGSGTLTGTQVADLWAAGTA